jgi:hypothetical protein
VIKNSIAEHEIPMVCFCDLPLSALDKHMGLSEEEGYGKYGLGMSKDWGIAQKLNPVTYFTEESHVLRGMLDVTDRLYRIKQHYDAEMEKLIKKYGAEKLHKKVSFRERMTVATYDYSNRAFDASRLAQQYYKPYKNALNQYRYYDEREWRYVPSLTDNPAINVSPIFAKDKDYEAKKTHYKVIIERHHMLSFNANDIKYIIVREDSSVDELIKRLSSIEKYSDQDRNRLIGRIITYDQILEDF